MRLGRVVGRVVATRRDPGLGTERLLLVLPVDRQGTAIGPAQVMLDAIGAGASELVFFTRGREASLPFLPGAPPADATVVGIVDHYHADGKSWPGITKTSA